jgi:hypothetical protein
LAAPLSINCANVPLMPAGIWCSNGVVEAGRMEVQGLQEAGDDSLFLLVLVQCHAELGHTDDRVPDGSGGYFDCPLGGDLLGLQPFQLELEKLVGGRAPENGQPAVSHDPDQIADRLLRQGAVAVIVQVRLDGQLRVGRAGSPARGA